MLTVKTVSDRIETDRQSYRVTEIQIQRGRETARPRDRETDRHRDRETERQRDLASLGLSVSPSLRRQKYRKYDVYLTGHSLGGMIAMSIGVRHAFVKGGHVFNAGAGGREMLRLVGLSHDAYDKLSKKFLHHHILFDGISAAFSRGKLVVYRPAFRYITNPHSMNHFLPEKWYAW